MISILENIWKTYFDFHYSAAFSIGIILFICSGVILYSVEKKQRNVIGKKEIAILLLFSVYMTFLLGVTLFNRHPEESYRVELQPLWSYIETISSGNYALGWQIFYNIVAFVPLGIFLPLLTPRMRRLRNILIGGFLLSVFIECSQLVFKCGLCELDDILDNSIGAVLGYGVWREGNRIAKYIKYWGKRDCIR